jgi:hypothetical protein
MIPGRVDDTILRVAVDVHNANILATSISVFLASLAILLLHCQYLHFKHHRPLAGSAWPHHVLIIVGVVDRIATIAVNTIHTYRIS